MLRIGEFARLADVSIKLLRHYDEIGLLPAHAIDRNTGYRYYTVTQLARLQRLLVYRSLGFSLREIQRLASAEASTDELRDMLHTHRADLQAKIAAERARLDEIETRLAQLDRDGRPSTHEVSIRSLDVGTAASLRHTCSSYDDVGDLLRSLRSKLPRRTAVLGYGAIWHRCIGLSDAIECEALVFIDTGRSSYPTETNIVRLAACTVASVALDGSVEDSRPAYRAAIERARHLGYGVAGPIRERYANHGTPGSIVTEAQFPLCISPR